MVSTLPALHSPAQGRLQPTAQDAVYPSFAASPLPFFWLSSLALEWWSRCGRARAPAHYAPRARSSGTRGRTVHQSPKRERGDRDQARGARQDHTRVDVHPVVEGRAAECHLHRPVTAARCHLRRGRRDERKKAREEGRKGAEVSKQQILCAQMAWSKSKLRTRYSVQSSLTARAVRSGRLVLLQALCRLLAGIRSRKAQHLTVKRV
jgi:hypothetical protein